MKIMISTPFFREKIEALKPKRNHIIDSILFIRCLIRDFKKSFKKKITIKLTMLNAKLFIQIDIANDIINHKFSKNFFCRVIFVVQINFKIVSILNVLKF